jgi:hypothetical protein
MKRHRAPTDSLDYFTKKKCWETIRLDLLAALQGFHSLRTQKLELINEANVVLLPKTSDAASVTDFRPISLINSLAKIITKVLADRLAPRLNKLVSTCQNAFIKKRCIHDNFIYVQSVIKALHKAKRPTPSSSYTFPRHLIQLVGSFYSK